MGKYKVYKGFFSWLTSAHECIFYTLLKLLHEYIFLLELLHECIFLLKLSLHVLRLLLVMKKYTYMMTYLNFLRFAQMKFGFLSLTTSSLLALPQ